MNYDHRESEISVIFVEFYTRLFSLKNVSFKIFIFAILLQIYCIVNFLLPEKSRKQETYRQLLNYNNAQSQLIILLRIYFCMYPARDVMQ